MLSDSDMPHGADYVLLTADEGEEAGLLRDGNGRGERADAAAGADGTPSAPSPGPPADIEPANIMLAKKSGRRRAGGIIAIAALLGLALRNVSTTFILLMGGWDRRPDFVFERPYVASSYYTSTRDADVLKLLQDYQESTGTTMADDDNNFSGSNSTRPRLAIVRPFCEFDAEPLPATFSCWNDLQPCESSPPHGVAVDLFLYYSQTYSENDEAVRAVDSIIKNFYLDIEGGALGWSRCFDRVYAIEGNIPQEVDLYIPSAQEELHTWVNGPNRQFERLYREIQTRNWGIYDGPLGLGVFLMEGDMVPVKAFWLDRLVQEIEANRPFAILGSRYLGDKWDNMDAIDRGTYQWYHYDDVPPALSDHQNGNSIYNTSHPLLERLVSQLEIEAASPYTSIPYDYRMSQIWVEGLTGKVPRLPPKILINEEGHQIQLANNTDMFQRWAVAWREKKPFKYSTVMANYAATNLLPRHLGEEHLVHGAKFYSPWEPSISVTLVVSGLVSPDSNSDPPARRLLDSLDRSIDHPFSEVVVILPALSNETHYNAKNLRSGTGGSMAVRTERRLAGVTRTIPVRTQRREEGIPAFMDLCQVNVDTDWFMIATADHRVRRRVNLMFTPGTFRPVVPFTPATYRFCFSKNACRENVILAERFNPGHYRVVEDLDMLFHVGAVNEFCTEWKGRYGTTGEKLYSDEQGKEDNRERDYNKETVAPFGPTATSYLAYLVSKQYDWMYKLADGSLYGARPAFLLSNGTGGVDEDNCLCYLIDEEARCLRAAHACGCVWRPRFETCHERFSTLVGR